MSTAIAKTNPSPAFSMLSIGFCLLGIAIASPARGQDIELKVGIVQRFGEETSDELTIGSSSGDKLTLTFTDSQGETQTRQSDRVKLEVVQHPLANPGLEERLVLSDHATFETAEDSAKQWQALGLQVEVTQPERWQVWAKRDVYGNPLLRRWLLQSLKARGYTQPYLDSAIVSEVPRVAVSVNEQRYDLDRLEITTDKKLVQVTDEKQQSRLYGGNLILQPNAYGTFTLVNQVSLETYLRGVVPHEIGPEAPDSATKAQTIIARTYALRNLRRFQADNYELCADVHCQVYYGLSGTSDRADRAIAATKGLVLTYGNELVDALYSSTTGGVTASFSDVWDGEERPYLRAVIDSPHQVWDLSRQSLADEATFRRFIAMQQGFNETGRNVFRWNKQSTIENLNKDLKKYLERRRHPLSNFTTIQAMEVVERSPSGRILTLEVQTDRGMLELHKNEVRSAFGPPTSTLFYLDPVYDEQQQLKAYSFIGGGLGHGVGLSQYGSYNLAKLGWSSEQILAFYYPGTKLQPLNSSIIFWQDKD